MEQGSQEWREARLGKATASRIADVVRSVKSGGYAASRANYMAQLVRERLGCVDTEGFVSDAMRWGTEQEPNARAAYELFQGVLVDQVGFVDHPSIPMSGASPDGLVGEDGLVEFKCPNTATHFDTLVSEKIDPDYIKQMHWEMICTGRKWCDFVSYDPRVPERMQLYVQRVEIRPLLVGALEAEVVKFLADVDAQVSYLRAKYLEAA